MENEIVIHRFSKNLPHEQFLQKSDAASSHPPGELIIGSTIDFFKNAAMAPIGRGERHWYRVHIAETLKWVEFYALTEELEGDRIRLSVEFVKPAQ